MFGSKDLLFSSEKYGVAKSLRFRSSATAYLSRTFSTSRTLNTKGTFSAWVKRGSLGSDSFILGGYDGSSTGATALQFKTDNTLMFDFGGSAANSTITTQVFRDVSSWYHILLVIDTTSATTTINGGATDRVRLYINGNQISAFSTTSVPAQNSTWMFALNTANNKIGTVWNNSGGFFDGYLTEVNFIDGQALTPSAFGFYDNNGIWQPKGYTGTYGTNGFYLKFTDVGATSGSNSGYGKDFSGFNTNYWTTNNFGTTSTLVSYDSMYDSPVNASNGITGIGNYCVMNPLDRNTGTLSDGNLTWVNGNASNYCSRSTIQLPTTGLWYAEATTVSQPGATVGFAFGLATASASLTYPTANSYIGQAAATQSFYNGTSAVTITAWSAQAAGDVFQVAYDATNNQVWFGKNNVWSNSTGGNTGNPSTGANPTITSLPTNLFFFIGSYQNNSNLNFGQRPFAYTPPTNFLALNTQNLPTPTISNGAAYMAAVTYQGATAPNTVTTTSSNSGNNPLGISFQPDLVWIKSRSAATDHKWTDSVRGATKALISNTTGAETTDTNGLTAFTASGFTVGSDTTYNNTTGPATYVAWEWSKGVSQGFDIVTYTGNGSNRTISHSLNAIPSMMIVKQRTASSTTNWAVYHSALANTEYLLLNTTAAKATGATYWNSTTPTASVFSLGTAADVNTNTGTYVNWLFAPVAGYSAFGSYTGNGNADGPFIYTGFRPRFILIKMYSGAVGQSWSLHDTSRSPYNVDTIRLQAESSNAENNSTSNSIDILSNGFKIRTTDNEYNNSSYSYIYAVFAENPFKIARAR